MATMSPSVSALEPGTRIEVRCHFNCSWSRGFEVAAVEFEAGLPWYRIRRPGDELPLPALFPGTEVREAAPAVSPLTVLR